MKNQAALGSLSRCHSVLKWKFAVGRMNNGVFRSRIKWLSGNYIVMSNEILETGWNKLFYGQDVDFCYSLFVEKFHQLCEKYVPESKKLNRTGAPWFTNEIRSMIRQIHKLWYRVKSSRSSELKEEYLRVCRELRQKIKTSKLKSLSFRSSEV